MKKIVASCGRRQTVSSGMENERRVTATSPTGEHGIVWKVPLTTERPPEHPPTGELEAAQPVRVASGRGAMMVCRR